MKQQTRGLIAMALGALVWSSSTTAEPNKVEWGVRTDAIRAHMGFLADDLLEGREAGTRGYDIAAKCVAAQFAAVGLDPGAGNGSCFQQVPLRKSTLVSQSAMLTIKNRQVASEMGLVQSPDPYPDAARSPARITIRS